MALVCCFQGQYMRSKIIVSTHWSEATLQRRMKTIQKKDRKEGEKPNDNVKIEVLRSAVASKQPAEGTTASEKS